jgi:hypothetical protein
MRFSTPLTAVPFSASTVQGARGGAGFNEEEIRPGVLEGGGPNESDIEELRGFCIEAGTLGCCVGGAASNESKIEDCVPLLCGGIWDPWGDGATSNESKIDDCAPPREAGTLCGGGIWDPLGDGATSNESKIDDCAPPREAGTLCGGGSNSEKIEAPDCAVFRPDAVVGGGASKESKIDEEVMPCEGALTGLGTGGESKASKIEDAVVSTALAVNADARESSITLSFSSRSRVSVYSIIDRIDAPSSPRADKPLETVSDEANRARTLAFIDLRSVGADMKSISAFAFAMASVGCRKPSGVEEFPETAAKPLWAASSTTS